MPSPALLDQESPSVVCPKLQVSSSSVAKMLLLLKSFPVDVDGVGVTQLAREVGISKSTAFRLIVKLEEHGFLERIGRRYRLSWRMFELGSSVAKTSSVRVTPIARPHLCELFADTGAAVSLVVVDGRELVCTQRIEGVRAVTDSVTVGSRLPASCTASGKIILAFSDSSMIRRALAQPLEAATPRSITNPALLLDELRGARREGVASDVGEWRLGLASLAAPILREGRPVGAISLTVPSRAFNPSLLRGRLVNAANAIALELATRAETTEA